MNILITGATGFIGAPLTKKLQSQGHSIYALTRNESKAKKTLGPEIKCLTLDLSSQDIKEIEIVINLMGENISGGRWNSERKKRIRSSRVNNTQKLVDAFSKLTDSKLETWINASAIGIYPENTGEVLTENSPHGNGFLSNVCKEWEQASLDIKKSHPDLRHIIFRFGVVLDKSGGALAKMLPAFKVGVGGPLGNGEQYMSWIHRDDLVKLLSDASTNSNYEGIYNATTPNPVTNFEFTKTLGSTLHRPTVLKVPAKALKLLFGEMSSILLDSHHVMPKHLLDQSFEFKYPTLKEALKTL